MVRFSAHLTVLLPFLVLVVEPALLAPDQEVVFYLYCFSYVLSLHICFLLYIVLIILWILLGTSLYGDF